MVSELAFLFRVPDIPGSSRGPECVSQFHQMGLDGTLNDVTVAAASLYLAICKLS
jgi:hypothetical protein